MPKTRCCAEPLSLRDKRMNNTWILPSRSLEFNCRNTYTDHQNRRVMATPEAVH